MELLHQCQRNEVVSDLIARLTASLDGLNVERLTIGKPLPDSKEKKGYDSVGSADPFTQNTYGSMVEHDRLITR
jgi:hypothetical protein